MQGRSHDNISITHRVGCISNNMKQEKEKTALSNSKPPKISFIFHSFTVKECIANLMIPSTLKKIISENRMTRLNLCRTCTPPSWQAQQNKNMQHFDINKASYIDAHSFLFSLQHILLTHSFIYASFSPFLTYLLPIQLLQTCFHMKTDHGNSYSLTDSSEYSIHFNFSFCRCIYKPIKIISLRNRDVIPEYLK